MSICFFISPIAAKLCNGMQKTPAWWRHHMKTFSALLAICAGNSPVTGEFPAQRPVKRDVGVFFDLRLTRRLSKQWRSWWFETPSCQLWRHCNEILHYLWEKKNLSKIMKLHCFRPPHLSLTPLFNAVYLMDLVLYIYIYIYICRVRWLMWHYSHKQLYSARTAAAIMMVGQSMRMAWRHLKQDFFVNEKVE